MQLGDLCIHVGVVVRRQKTEDKVKTTLTDSIVRFAKTAHYDVKLPI